MKRIRLIASVVAILVAIVGTGWWSGSQTVLSALPEKTRYFTYFSGEGGFILALGIVCLGILLAGSAIYLIWFDNLGVKPPSPQNGNEELTRKKERFLSTTGSMLSHRIQKQSNVAKRINTATRQILENTRRHADSCEQFEHYSQAFAEQSDYAKEMAVEMVRIMENVSETVGKVQCSMDFINGWSMQSRVIVVTEASKETSDKKDLVAEERRLIMGALKDIADQTVSASGESSVLVSKLQEQVAKGLGLAWNLKTRVRDFDDATHRAATYLAIHRDEKNSAADTLRKFETMLTYFDRLSTHNSAIAAKISRACQRNGTPNTEAGCTDAIDTVNSKVTANENSSAPMIASA